MPLEPPLAGISASTPPASGLISKLPSGWQQERLRALCGAGGKFLVFAVCRCERAPLIVEAEPSLHPALGERNRVVGTEPADHSDPDGVPQRGGTRPVGVKDQAERVRPLPEIV